MKKKTQIKNVLNESSNLSVILDNLNVVSIKNQSTQPIQKSLNITNLNSIDNLYTIHNQLEFLNLSLQNTYEKQKESTDRLIFERINEINNLREYIFSLSSKLNNMMNISKIETYFNINYSKILSTLPKINNTLENIDDLKININYALDRLYLEDNIVSDENCLKRNFEMTVDNLNKLNKESEDKFGLIKEVKNNYLIYLKQIDEQKNKIKLLQSLLKRYKKKILDESVDHIFQKLIGENKKFEEEILAIKN